ncbi:hypothetical protein AAG906_015525 [Vitis piasezkii]
MTTRGVPVPASILFTIDGRQDAGPHFLSGTWFVSYLEGHLPRGPFSGGSFPQGCS